MGSCGRSGWSVKVIVVFKKNVKTDDGKRSTREFRYVRWGGYVCLVYGEVGYSQGSSCTCSVDKLYLIRLAGVKTRVIIQQGVSHKPVCAGIVI